MRLDAEFAAATTKAISVTMDVELLTRFWQNRSFWDNVWELFWQRDVKFPPQSPAFWVKSVRAEDGPPAMADGDGLDGKIGKYAEYFSLMAESTASLSESARRFGWRSL